MEHECTVFPLLPDIHRSTQHVQELKNYIGRMSSLGEPHEVLL